MLPAHVFDIQAPSLSMTMARPSPHLARFRPLRRLRDRYGEGTWAIVTGASDGIGRAFAQQLASAGFNIVLVARRAAILDELAASMQGQHDVDVLPLALDLSRPESLAILLAKTQMLDVGLVVAAAGFGTSGEFLAQSIATELEMIDVNCRAVVAMAHAFGSRLSTRGRGGIVLMSSLLAFQGVPRAATYAATKAFIQTFAEGLARELKARGVDVVASAPGPILSGFAERAHMTMSFAQTPDAVAGVTLGALGRRTTVRPGWLSKLLEWSLALLPRFGRVRVMQRVMRSMTNGTP